MATQSKQISISKKETNVELTSPKQLIAFSNDLKQMIVENGLYVPIQNKRSYAPKNYVTVEGWQMAGALCGLYPIVELTENMSTDNEIKYRAKVAIRNRKDDKIEGVGFATCSNKEKGKGGFQEYAIESMAQTRAIGKAYRTILGYLLKMAGYEATPWEEMQPIVEQEVEVTVEPEVIKEETLKPEPKPKSKPKKKEETSQAEKMKQKWNNEYDKAKKKIRYLLDHPGVENVIIEQTIQSCNDGKKVADSNICELELINEQLDCLMEGVTNE